MRAAHVLVVLVRPELEMVEFVLRAVAILATLGWFLVWVRRR